MDFAFTGILDQNASQEDIFDAVAKPVVLKYLKYLEFEHFFLLKKNSCLEGYNGTIFAYGQTGSGKTFTMSGSGIFNNF